MRLKRIVATGVAIVFGIPLLLIAGVLATVAAMDRTNGAIRSLGIDRQYLIHVPVQYHSDSPVPLVLSFHAAAMWPASQAKTSGWNALADEHGFIVVYPAGTGTPRVWQPSPASARKDARFVSDLIDTLQARYSIDASRIYATGLSNGAHMAFVLSCEMGHRIAAVGTVAAAHQLPWSWCASRRPMPLIAFHGTADPLVPYDGGASSMAAVSFPSASGFAAHWAQRNGCGEEPTLSEVAPDVARSVYPDCPDGADVVFYSINGGGHTWPGGPTRLGWVVGPTTRSIDASALMWDFFEAHRVRPSEQACHVR